MVERRITQLTQLQYCRLKDWVKGWHKPQCEVLRDPCFQQLMHLDFDKYEEPFSFKEAAVRPVSAPPSPYLQTADPARLNHWTPMPGIPPSSPTFTLLISLSETVPWREEWDMITSLNSKAHEAQCKVGRPITAHAALALLKRRPSAVLISDEALTRRKHREVWEAVIDYVYTGGTAVIMGFFSLYVKLDYLPFFFQQAGLKWNFGFFKPATVALNEAAVPEGLRQRVPASYSQEALFLQNVDRAVAWYTRTEDSRAEPAVFAPEKTRDVTESPVAFARVGHGNLGFVGDVNVEEEGGEVISAMCGLGGGQRMD